MADLEFLTPAQLEENAHPRLVRACETFIRNLAAPADAPTFALETDDATTTRPSVRPISDSYEPKNLVSDLNQATDAKMACPWQSIFRPQSRTTDRAAAMTANAHLAPHVPILQAGEPARGSVRLGLVLIPAVGQVYLAQLMVVDFAAGGLDTFLVAQEVYQCPARGRLIVSAPACQWRRETGSGDPLVWKSHTKRLLLAPAPWYGPVLQQPLWAGSGDWMEILQG